MKKLFALFSRIAVVTFIAAGLCFGVSTQAAQKKEESKTPPSPSASIAKSPATAALSAKDKSFMKDATQGRGDGSRDGQDGPAKRQERRREKDRRHDGGRSYQGEQRADGNREEEGRRSFEREAENEASERRELRQGIHRRDGEGPRRGSRGVSGRSEKRRRC